MFQFASHVISTPTLRGKAQRGYEAWVPELNVGTLIPEPEQDPLHMLPQILKP